MDEFEPGAGSEPVPDLEPGPGEAADDVPDPGTSFVLTPEGWEETDFVPPGESWTIASDGSYLSPDGLTRTWPRNEPVEWSDVAATEE